MKYLFILIAILLIRTNYSQEHGYGVLLDSTLYKNSPSAAPQMRSIYNNLPASVSLKDYVPTPGDQGSTSTCGAWASAYAGRTILAAMKYNWEKDSIDINAFSPSFIYNQIRVNKSCNGGTSLLDALDLMKDLGGIKFSEFGFECSRDVTDQEKQKAENFKISEYRDIFTNQSINKVTLVKKSIAEMHPVVIAFDCPPSFQKAKDVLKVDSSEYSYWGKGHGLAVIGYDDDKYGGAFEIINSWGTHWGNKGFTWIRYSDFQFFCIYAFELIDKEIPDLNKNDLSGTLIFTQSTGEEMRVKQKQDFFTLEKPYQSGTKFELRISNNEPAYVYAFSSDLTYKTYKIFPFTDRMVAYLPYKENDVAIPDEYSYNMLDSIKGKTYFCFLYSKEKLDLQAIMKSVENSKGNMWERVKKSLGNLLINRNNIEYSLTKKISFQAKSRGRSVVPVLIEIKHY